MTKMSTKTGDQVEAQTRQIGRELWERLERRRPTVFEPRWWLDHILEWATTDEAVKVQMFRFVDALPMLKTSESVSQHLQEYFEEVRQKLPLAARLGLDVAEPGSMLGKALAFSARTNARKMAERFIAGTNPAEVYDGLFRLRRKGLAFTLDLLGEAVLSEGEADAYQQAYLGAIADLAPRVAQWHEHPLLDAPMGKGDSPAPDGIVPPRCSISLKLSALDSQFQPVDARGTTERVKARLRPILQAAQEHGVHVYIDMEQSQLKPLTLAIVQSLLMEEEFRSNPHYGVVLQAYLKDSAADLETLRAWAEKRGTPISVRLVKGAYWESETATAAYHGWPCPVFAHKWESDRNFERLTAALFENRQWLRPAIASHNLRSLSYACALSKALDIPPADWEIQMLYGMAEDQALLLAEAGYRLRIYTPFGERIPGMAYLVRRLLENTSNDSFLRHAYDRDARIDELLGTPGPDATAAASPTTVV